MGFFDDGKIGRHLGRSKFACFCKSKKGKDAGMRQGYIVAD
jgi:hypothetical protein